MYLYKLSRMRDGLKQLPARTVEKNYHPSMCESVCAVRLRRNDCASVRQGRAQEVSLCERLNTQLAKQLYPRALRGLRDGRKGKKKNERHRSQ